MLINSWLAFVKKTLQKSHSHCPSMLDRSRRRRSVNAPFAAEALEDRVLLSAGSLDTSFGNSGIVTTNFIEVTNYPGWSDSASSVALQGDGKMVVAGTTQPNGAPLGAISRYNSDGSLDTTFSIDGRISDSRFNTLQDVEVQADGKVVVVGRAHPMNGAVGNFAIGRFNADGSPDATFGTNGIVITNPGVYDTAYEVAILNDDRILVTGQSGHPGAEQPFGFTLQQFNANGTVDMNFGSGGLVRTFYSTAEVPSNYGGVGNVAARDVVVQPDGKIVVAGQSAELNNKFAVVRYHADGSLDTSFDSDGRVSTSLGNGKSFATSIALQGDGKLVVGGYFLSNTGSDHDFALIRYNTDGSLDTSFNGDGTVVLDFGSSNDFVYDVKVQSDGAIVATGSVGGVLAVARFNSDGSLDASFGTSGLTTTAVQSSSGGSELVIQPDGGIVVAGTVNNGSGNGFTNRDFLVARYVGISNTPPTITSDGGGDTASVNAAENQLAVTDVQATDDNDAEGAGLVYSLSGGADQASFSIDANTGVLTFNTVPDFENPTDAGLDNVYDVQVTVTDAGSLTDVQDIAVTVTDINEAPVINGGTLAGTITETADAAPGVDADPFAATGTVTFQDPDLADNPSASIVGSSVTSTSLALSAAQEAALLDNLTLDPVEFSNVDGSGSVDWTYDVPNSEIDFLGVSDSVQLTYTVEVNDQSGSAGLQTFEGHTYQFIPDYNSQNFADVNAAAASLAFNGVQGHLATITSAAENTFLYNTFRSQVLAEATAHNDNYPQAWAGGYSPTASSITNPNNGWQWSNGEDWGYSFWRAGEPNGWRDSYTSAMQLDFVSPNRPTSVDGWNDTPAIWHNIEGYIVEWDTAATGATDTVDVVVTINGTNDAPTAPVDDDSANNEVFENAAVGTPVGIDVSSTDVDAGTTIAYSLSDNAGGRFQIDANTGVATVANASLLNYEDDTSHNITVVADDGSGTANATSSRTFTINVIDVNEAPSVALINTTNSLVENTDTGSSIKVADIVVTDDALGTNTLSLSGIDAVMFEISGAELFLKAGSTVDFETNPILDVTVEVDDSTVGATPDDLAALAINVIDIDPVHLTCAVSDDVQALKDAGELGNGQANPIINHLGQAKASLAKGKITQAVKKLEQGRDELQDLIDGGGLNAGVVAQLEALVEDLNDVITEIQSGSA